MPSSTTSDTAGNNSSPSGFFTKLRDYIGNPEGAAVLLTLLFAVVLLFLFALIWVKGSVLYATPLTIIALVLLYAVLNRLPAYGPEAKPNDVVKGIETLIRTLRHTRHKGDHVGPDSPNT